MGSGRRPKKKKKKPNDADIHQISYSSEEFIAMMNDTSKIIAKENTARLSSMGVAASESGVLTDNVEFWRWMDKNYSNCGHFSSAENMQQYYVTGTAGQQNWTKKVVQGKGYEWDWMSYQRRSFKNLFKIFDAGEVANRPGSDITERNLLSGTEKEYQLKAYTSSSTPHLKNTPKEMTVVTNAEKVEQVSNLGYEDVISFGDKKTITEARDDRLQQIASGTATPNYTVKSVGMATAKAGMMGFIISAGAETIISYRKWKNGEISTQKYLKEIMKSGGNASITSSCSASIMIPVTAKITTAGVSSIITIPISFVVSSTVEKVVAPAFKRGDYLKILKEATYYQNMATFCGSLAVCVEEATSQYISFIQAIVAEQEAFNNLSDQSLSRQAYDDFEYYASLPQEEINFVVSGMLAVVNDTDEKLAALETQNFVQRMLKTVIGKNKATKEEIKKNYELLTVYISKAVQILFERQCIDQKIIQILGTQIIALRKDNIALAGRIEILESKMDNFTDSLLFVNDSILLGDSTVSAKEIIDNNARKKLKDAETLFNQGRLMDAFDLFCEAADNGVGRACYYLGLYYVNGYGHLKENRSNALDAWRKGMELGEPLSTFEYGLVKFDSDSYQLKKWTGKHLNAIIRLTKKEDPLALYEFGWQVLSDDPENTENLVDALGYFKRAAEKGFWPGAQVFYQFTEDLRKSGTVLPDYSGLIENVEYYQTHVLLGLGHLSIELNEPDYMAKHFHSALWLREDIVEPAAYLGFLLNTGLVKESLADGFSKNNAKMYYEAGLRSDNPLVLYQVGTFYLNGFSEKEYGKDSKLAFDYFLRSYNLSRQGFTAGVLGYMYLVGEGVNEDDETAIAYLEEGYRMGDKGSTVLLSMCFEHGFGVKKDAAMQQKLKVEADQMPDLDEMYAVRIFIKERLEEIKAQMNIQKRVD